MDAGVEQRREQAANLVLSLFILVLPFPFRRALGGILLLTPFRSENAADQFAVTDAEEASARRYRAPRRPSAFAHSVHCFRFASDYFAQSHSEITSRCRTVRLVVASSVQRLMVCV
jgi:hypothetical protein